MAPCAYYRGESSRLRALFPKTRVLPHVLSHPAASAFRRGTLEALSCPRRYSKAFPVFGVPRVSPSQLDALWFDLLVCPSQNRRQTQVWKSERRTLGMSICKSLAYTHRAVPIGLPETGAWSYSRVPMGCVREDSRLAMAPPCRQSAPCHRIPPTRSSGDAVCRIDRRAGRQPRLCRQQHARALPLRSLPGNWFVR